MACSALADSRPHALHRILIYCICRLILVFRSKSTQTCSLQPLESHPVTFALGYSCHMRTPNSHSLCSTYQQHLYMASKTASRASIKSFTPTNHLHCEPLRALDTPLESVYFLIAHTNTAVLRRPLASTHFASASFCTPISWPRTHTCHFILKLHTCRLILISRM
jgi:hypothetical protein